ncbi:MAG: alpha/beta hydrolase [Asticcacaulis sp.]|nr:alpha/beta hydrolase [Asticcacaulis sp.]
MERFEFTSDGVRLIGNLYRPDGAPKGLVVTTGPLTSVKEQAAGAYAKAMADRGYIALAFDHRYFGESDGRPRQFENPYAKADDVNAAVVALKAIPEFAALPVYGVGVCAGGGYMAKAVVNGTTSPWHFAGFAGVAGVYPDRDQTRAWMGDTYDKAKARAQAALERFNATGEAETIPAVAPDNGDVAMPLTEAYEYYGTARGQVPNYVNGFAVQSRLYTLDFDVQTIAADITPPTIMVHSERALLPVWAHAFYARLTAPKAELWLESQGQIDFYDDPRLIDAASDAIDAFFTAGKA